jgi:DNA-binding MarR family transcriptional regulator
MTRSLRFKKTKLKKVKKNPGLEKLYEEYREVRGRQYRLDAIFRELVSKRVGMTITELSCLSYLSDKGQATAGELAKITGLTSGAITGLISRLERKGCITYVRDTKDRRKVILRPVEKKMALPMHYYRRLSEKYYRLLSTFDENQIEFLMYKSKSITKMLLEEIEKLSKQEQKI